ncbi:MAG: helicase-related protein, partial [Pirellulales bacterium]
VLMRYTLRLLTLDQLGRASALICALELERENNERLGKWPFEIGLWVGQAATPNRMGARGERDPEHRTAYFKTRDFRSDSKHKPAPIPIEQCPWCGTKFTGDSFRLSPNEVNPLDLQVHCVNHQCDFSGNRALPVLGVDEPIYRRLPCFLIATVDKFAALPWTGEVGTLFGKVERYDKEGFYGPCDPGKGIALPDGPLPPPELIIQDELHLISGPLGTIAGLYETAIDALATRYAGEATIRPKIIASTATVRRADRQIRALFDRVQVRVFPPPGPDRKNSFFAKTLSPEESPARLYVGVAAQGRSLKVVLLRAGLALLSAGRRAFDEAGGKRVRPNPADPYMSLLGYFNSLRELGGTRRIIEDEVCTRLSEYGRRQRWEPDDQLFADRKIDFQGLELTSRVPTNRVAEAKRRLALPMSEDECVDVALATNMISVGLDIVRLGLMVVLGQPKASAEYIQATSRVGRDPKRPGLVVTLLNIHKPRDRSHYERFTAYHASFYRNVEATSVTPFSPRAMDRALAAAVVALARQGRRDMTAPAQAAHILQVRSELEAVAERFAQRAAGHYPGLTQAEKQLLHDSVKHVCNDLLDDWLKIAQRAQQEG